MRFAGCPTSVIEFLRSRVSLFFSRVLPSSAILSGFNPRVCRYPLFPPWVRLCLKAPGMKTTETAPPNQAPDAKRTNHHAPNELTPTISRFVPPQLPPPVAERPSRSGGPCLRLSPDSLRYFRICPPITLSFSLLKTNIFSVMRCF